MQELDISGIVKFGSVSTIGGATLAGFDLPTAQRIFAKKGKLDEIAVAARSGVSDEQLVQDLRPILPANTEVQTAAEQARSDAEDTDEFISFLQTFLLVFAGVALFVGSFVIANSLSITIAQRTREFATLRTIGASRRQVLTSIIVESLVVGVIASVIGLFLGLGLAKVLFWLFDAVGFTLPNTGLLFETRTIVVALLVGVLVTLAASLRPAIRATRVPPIAAVREGATLPESRFARFRTIGAILLTRARLRRAALRALRKRPRHDPDPALHGRGRAARLLRRRALRLEARPGRSPRPSAGPRPSWAAPPASSPAETRSETRSARPRPRPHS